jgi:hypothetical protein
VLEETVVQRIWLLFVGVQTLGGCSFGDGNDNSYLLTVTLKCTQGEEHDSPFLLAA